jgi:hypothetical protein
VTNGSFARVLIAAPEAAVPELTNRAVDPEPPIRDHISLRRFNCIPQTVSSELAAAVVKALWR